MQDMRHPTYIILLIIGLLSVSACGPKISQENYINLMSDLGCGLVAENSPQSEAIYKKYGATQADIQQFRQKTKRETMMQVSQDIAKRVAACHGVTIP
jgi:hypothetical protein